MNMVVACDGDTQQEYESLETWRSFTLAFTSSFSSVASPRRESHQEGRKGNHGGSVCPSSDGTT